MTWVASDLESITLPLRLKGDHSRPDPDLLRLENGGQKNLPTLPGYFLLENGYLNIVYYN